MNQSKPLHRPRSSQVLSVAYFLMSFSFLLAIFPVANAASSRKPTSVSNQARARHAIEGLQSRYDKLTGLYRTTGWWNSANAITTLADYSRVANTRKFNSVFKNTFKTAQKAHPGFINEYYDDEGWWALAWIDVYDHTHREQYLSMAESIFTDMSGGWSDACSGGIWWSKKRQYKNAIANELFLSVAAHLANRASTAQQRANYLDWANREWRWFAQSGMINSRHLINDGLNARCVNNGRTAWTYNQGVILGGLADLYRADSDRSLLTQAEAIASAVLSDQSLVDEANILHEPCEPKCGADATQFKGIFVRNLSELDQLAPSPSYEGFILTNAKSIWAGARAPEYDLGLIWSSPHGKADASTQSSAADTLVAAMGLSDNQ